MQGVWIEYKGGDVSPLPDSWIVEVQRTSGRYDKSEAGSINWTNVVAYRVVNSDSQQTKANDIQVAGDHYKSKVIQPWDFIAANNIGFFEGNAIKYLTRWRGKGGVEDLRKAKHYIDKLIELQEQA